MAKKLSPEQQKEIDDYAKARDAFGLNSREGARLQNVINAEMGVKKRRDWSNLPTSNQMKIAEKGRNEVVATLKASKSPLADIAKNVLKGSTDDEIKKALAGSKTIEPKKSNRKTKHSKTMMGGAY